MNQNLKTKQDTNLDIKKGITSEQWEAEGEKLFGKDKMKWRFICPSCGHVASVQDWKDAGAGPGEIAFSCVGRHLKDSANAFSKETKKGGPCNYAGGGLFRINTKHVEDDYYFEFDHGI